MTDPTKYCKDLETYEDALVAGVEELRELMDKGFITWQAGKSLWYGLLNGLYGDRDGTAKNDM